MKPRLTNRILEGLFDCTALISAGSSENLTGYRDPESERQFTRAIDAYHWVIAMRRYREGLIPTRGRHERAMDIKVYYSSIDRFHETRRFKTLKGARKFAHLRVGAHPDLGSWYAVSSDGVGKIEVKGCTLAELFPPPAPKAGKVSGATDEP